MRFLLTIMAALAVTTLSLTADQVQWITDYTNGQRVAMENNKPMLLLFVDGKAASAQVKQSLEKSPVFLTQVLPKVTPVLLQLVESVDAGTDDQTLQAHNLGGALRIDSPPALILCPPNNPHDTALSITSFTMSADDLNKSVAAALAKMKP